MNVESCQIYLFFLNVYLLSLSMICNELFFIFLCSIFRIERRKDTAFQALSSDFVLEVVIGDEELLDHLFTFLDVTPAGRKESNYFFRVLMVFLERFSHDLLLYLRSRDGIIYKVVQRIDDQSIVEMLYKFVDAGIYLLYSLLIVFL
jgi:hypothetical protein